MIAELAFFCQKGDSGALMTPVSPGQGYGIVTSWLQSKYSAIEFAFESDAPAAGEKSNRWTARPVYVSGCFHERPANLSVIVAEDDDAYWAMWKLSAKNLAAARQALLHLGDVHVAF